MKKILTLGLAFVIAFTAVFAGVKFMGNNKSVKAAEMEPTMKMPITIYDHLDDHFFFEYDLGTLMGMSMYQDYTEPGVPEGAGQGLISDTLGEDGTPVYTKEALERAAKIMKEYIEQEYTVDNELHNNIKDWVSTPGEDTLVSGNDTHRMNLQELGWTMSKATDYDGTYNQDKWKNGDDVIYYLDGDNLRTDVGGVDNIATFDFGELEAGTYTFYLYSANNMKVELIGPGVETVANGGDTVITLDQPGHLFVKATPLSDGAAAITHPSLYKGQGGERTTVIENITIGHDKPITKEGWVFPEGSSWSQSQYGGVTCDNGEDEAAYLDMDVEPGKSYVVYAQTNDSNLCVAEVTTPDGQKLADVGVNASKENKFEVPSGVNKVRLKVLPTGEGYKDTQPVRRFDNIHLKKLADVRLGDYEESKAAYTTNHTKNKIDDIETCMDYCYYVANNFWSNTGNDVTQKTDAYKTLTLNWNENKGMYEFDSMYKKTYDTENKNIFNPSNEADETNNQDFFPVDPDVLGDANDLTAPFGTTTHSAYVGDRNFHYAMKAHCEFYYDKASDLTFNFYGDDDVYLFINNKLVMDIGGAHPPKDGTVKINDIADSIGLQDGEVYSFDFFYMERHTDMSKLRVETNMVLLPADAKPSVTYKDKDGNELPEGSKVQAGEKVYPEYSVTAGVNGMKNVQFEDKENGFKIGKNGITLGDLEVDDKITVQIKDKNGVVKKTISIDKDKINDMNYVDVFVDTMMNSVLDKDDTLTLTGVHKVMPVDDVVKTELHTEITAPNISYNDDGHVVVTDEPVSLNDVTNYVVPENEPKATLDVKIVDNNGVEMTGKVTEGTEAGVEYKLTADSDSMDNIGINDTGIGFKMDKNGITIPDDFTIPNGLEVTLNKDGNETKVTLTQADIENKTQNYNNLLKALGEDWKLDKDDYITVKGLKTNVPAGGLKADAKASIDGPVPSYNEETGQVTVTPETVNPTDVAEVGAKDNVKVKFIVDNTKGATAEGDKMDYTVDVGETTGAQPTVTAKQGYTFTGWKKFTDSDPNLVDADDPKSETITENTTYVAQFEPIKYPYTVKYVDEDGKDLLPVKQGAASDFDSVVTETAETIKGYSVDGDQSQDLTITADPDNNVIIFRYVKGGYDYTVKYVDEDGNEIAEQTHGSAKYGEDVQTSSKTIDGYSLISDDNVVLTMTDDPDQNVVTYVYSKNVNVKFKADNGGTLTGNTDDRSIKKGTKVEDVPNPTANTGYRFVGWEKTTTSSQDPTDVNDPAAETINEDTVFTAKFEPIKYPYTVKYVDEDGNELHASKTGPDTNFGETVTETAVTIAGYTVKGTKTQDLVITANADNNVITFVYEQGGYDYTIKYVDEDGNEIADPTEGSAKYGTTVNTHSKDITGYSLISPEDVALSITDDSTKNVVTYVYSKNPTVKFKADKGGELTGNTDDRNVKKGTKVNDIPTPEPKTGYEFAGWEKTTASSDDPVISTDPSDEVINEDTVFTAKFNPKKYDYIVKYVDEDGNNVLPPKAVNGADFDSDVTEKAEDVAGYEVIGDKTKTITIKEQDNEIVFVYKKAKYEVKYDSVNDGKITAGDPIQTVNYGDTTKEPTITPNKGYKFKGWVMIKEDGSETEIIDPTKVEITRNTVFKAKYEKEPEETTKVVPPTTKKTPKTTTKKNSSNKKTTKKNTDNSGNGGGDGTGATVDTSVTSPQTSNTMLFVVLAMMVMAMFGAVVSFVKVRRKN